MERTCVRTSRENKRAGDRALELRGNIEGWRFRGPIAIYSNQLVGVELHFDERLCKAM